MTTPNLESILSRLKKQEDTVIPKNIWDYVEAWVEKPPPTLPDALVFAAALLDLLQRQDERIAGLDGVIRAQEAMIQSALEPVGVNGPPWDHHAAEDAADLILALRAENKRLREASQNALLRLDPMRHLASPASWTDAPVDAAMKILEDALKEG